MRGTEARQPSGPGFWIFQDHDPEAKGEDRSFMAGFRKIGRSDVGHYKAVQGTQGDMIGFLLWTPGGGLDQVDETAVVGDSRPTQRTIAAWAAVFPAQNSSGGERRTVATGGAGGAGRNGVPGPGGAGAGGGGGAAGDGTGGDAAIEPYRNVFGFNPDPLVGRYPAGSYPTERTAFGFNPPALAFPARSSYPNSYIAFNGGRVVVREPGQQVAAWMKDASLWAGAGQSNVVRVATILRPTRDRTWRADGRFGPKSAPGPAGWPDIPTGFHGLVVMSTDDDRQIDYFHPTDPRLVAVHEKSDATVCSTIVCDLDGGTAPDPDRHARLSSLARVIRRPSNSPKGANSIAWPLGESGRKDVRGGYVCDAEATGTGRTTTPGRGRPATTQGGRIGYGEGGGITGFGTVYDGSQGRPSDLLALAASNYFGVFVPPAAGGGAGNIAGQLTVQRIDGVLQVFSQESRDSAPVRIDIPSRVYGPKPFRGSKPRTGPLVIACPSILDGGPFDVGGLKDPHRIGEDADGHPINALHFSTEALYRDRDAPQRDGPLLFEPEYRHGINFPDVTEVHLAWDAERKCWAWWSSTAFSEGGGYDYPEAPPTDTPRDDPPPHDPRRPITPGGGGGLRPGGGVGITPSSFDVGAPGPFEPRPLLASRREIGVPSIVARPQLIRDGAADLRYSRQPKASDIRHHEKYAPAVARLEAFGAQGGTKGGPHLDGPGSWDYTQMPGRSRSRGGTAPGGFVLLPPEYDLADIDAGFSRDVVTASPALLVLGPGTRLGFGTPELATGGLKSGWSIDNSGSDALTFATHDANGVRTSRLQLGQSSGHITLGVTTSSKSIKLLDDTQQLVLEVGAGQKLGFFGTAAVVKPTVSGARNDPEAALKDLLAELHTLGLINDTTTAS